MRILLIACCALLVLLPATSFGQPSVTIRIEEHGNANFGTPTALRTITNEASAPNPNSTGTFIVKHNLIGPERGDACAHPCKVGSTFGNDPKQLGNFRWEDFSANSFNRFEKSDSANLLKWEWKGAVIKNTSTATRYLKVIATTNSGAYRAGSAGARSYSLTLLGSFKNSTGGVAGSCAAAVPTATNPGVFCVKGTMRVNITGTPDPSNTVNTSPNETAPTTIVNSSNVLTFNANTPISDGEGPPFSGVGIQCSGCSPRVETTFFAIFNPGDVLTFSSSGSAGGAPVDQAFLLVTEFQLPEFINKWVRISGDGATSLKVIPESPTFSSGNSGGGSNVRWSWTQQRPTFNPLPAGDSVTLESKLSDDVDASNVQNNSAGLYFFTPPLVQLKELSGTGREISFTYGFDFGGALADGSSCFLEIGLGHADSVGLQETIVVPLDFDFDRPSVKIGCAAAALKLSGKNLPAALSGNNNPPAFDASGLTTFQKALNQNKDDLVLYIALRLKASAQPGVDQQISVSAANVDYGQGDFCLSQGCTSAVLVITGYQNDCNLFQDGVSARAIRHSDNAVIDIQPESPPANGNDCKYDIKFNKSLLGLTGADTVTAQFMLNGVFIPEPALDIYN